MSVESSIPLPVIGSEVQTACGDAENFAANTPRALYKGRWVFFCTPLCQQDFIEDPGSSCYKDQIENEAE
jgi:YHS domain-containing protein